MSKSRSDTTKAAAILGSFLLIEGWWVIVNASTGLRSFLGILGFAPGRLGTPLGWLLALIVTAAFTYYSARLPSVRHNMFRPSLLKLLAILMAVAAGILEEAIFRRMLMNHLQSEGFSAAVQIILSGLTFGVAHGIWGLFGRNVAAAVGATLATGALGTALGIVYIASHRSVASCIVAHVVIDFFIEPGLVLAAIRGEMRRQPLRDHRVSVGS
jgi:membrane protease YdiL (CAAX protease family)